MGFYSGCTVSLNDITVLDQLPTVQDIFQGKEIPGFKYILNDVCSANQGPLLEYPLHFQFNFAVSPRVLTTIFPAFLGTSLQFGKVLIMARSTTV